VKAPGSRSVESPSDAPLDDDDIDARQRQLTRQHQPGRAASCDHYRMFGHRHTAAGTMPVATSAADRPAARYSSADFALSGTFDFIFHFPG
jgi:hypothetical protein